MKFILTTVGRVNLRLVVLTMWNDNKNRAKGL